MDIGVGAVMFSSGLSQRKVRETKNSKGPSLISELVAVFKSSLIVFVMGFARIIIHNAVDY